MKIFKRKPKCLRRGRKPGHVFDRTMHCKYCGLSLVDIDRGYQRKTEGVRIIDG